LALDELVPTPDEVVEQSRAARAEIEAILEEVSSGQMTDVHDDGGWSIKDHLAHIAAWQWHTLGLIAGIPPHEAWYIDETTHQQLDLDGINEMIYERNKDRPLDDVLTDFRKAHEQAILEVSRMSEDDLARELPGRYQGGWVTIADAITGACIQHDFDHAEDIRMLANS
jgi:uncharacterized damage-inducible protein DinB